ncbi:MAG TPA: DUF2065 family protein [Tahibacter sp.]|uniref:DUF2065 domain-containing protein n=1 Tax=Tahibacter sp. TaxID=2056211 RepID=UPI002CBBD4E8|nr:DUF2065 family protein [Tahibacter sp.]HSX62642.1 DUF2065 family protein [Tahibacter sp.]
MKDLNAALCLVLVVEGLFLFALPAAWKRVAALLQSVGERELRIAGAAMIVIGLLALQLVRSVS